MGRNGNGRFRQYTFGNGHNRKEFFELVSLAKKCAWSRFNYRDVGDLCKEEGIYAVETFVGYHKRDRDKRLTLSCLRKKEELGIQITYSDGNRVVVFFSNGEYNGSGAVHRLYEFVSRNVEGIIGK